MCQYSFRGLTVHTDISPSVIYCALEAMVVAHPHLQEEQEEGGTDEKRGKEGKGWREWVLEVLEVTGDPLVPTPPRVLHPPHPRPRPHRHLHLLRRILL